jgi:putative toxin-antitoxin system antitoxin component (TIGR02293 family)
LYLTNLLSGDSNCNLKTISFEDTITIIKKGANGAVLSEVVNFIPVEILTKALNVHLRTFSKMRKKMLSSTDTSELYEVCLLWSHVSEFFEHNKDAVCKWLCTPIRALEGLPPLELMDSSYGRRAIVGCLETMKFGDFA